MKVIINKTKQTSYLFIQPEKAMCPSPLEVSTVHVLCEDVARTMCDLRALLKETGRSACSPWAEAAAFLSDWTVPPQHKGCLLLRAETSLCAEYFT